MNGQDFLGWAQVLLTKKLEGWHFRPASVSLPIARFRHDSEDPQGQSSLINRGHAGSHCRPLLCYWPIHIYSVPSAEPRHRDQAAFLSYPSWQLSLYLNRERWMNVLHSFWNQSSILKVREEQESLFVIIMHPCCYSITPTLQTCPFLLDIATSPIRKGRVVQCFDIRSPQRWVCKLKHSPFGATSRGRGTLRPDAIDFRMYEGWTRVPCSLSRTSQL